LGYESKDKVKLLSLQVVQQRRGAVDRGPKVSLAKGGEARF
jgi:hypothetical protein